MSQKIASVSVRIDADTKNDAEKVFAALGITPSAAVTMFYKQVALQNAIPFPLTTHIRPLSLREMTPAQLDVALLRGMEDVKAGRTVPAEEAFAVLREKYGHEAV